MHLRRPLSALATALLAAATASVALSPPSPAAPAAAAAPTIDVRPGTLPRGADPAFPVVVGRTIVDGERRTRVDIDGFRLLGRSSGGYVVGVPTADINMERIVRVRRDGSRKVLARVRGDDVVVSTDGSYLVRQHYRLGKDRRSVARLLDARTGELLAQRSFPGIRDVLDADAGRAVLSGDGAHPTVLWDALAGSSSTDVPRGKVRTITRRDGYFADLAADRLAVWTGDPYQGGCSVLSSLSDPDTTLWRSCDQRVTTVDASGRRVAVIGKLVDGLGPARVQVHAQRGRLLATYDIEGVFGGVRFESPSDVVLESYGRKQTAWVRCDAADCERATRTWPTPSF